MAIYHLSARVIGRSQGRSAVAAAAYRSAECLHDEQHDLIHDYTKKSGVKHREIMLPSGAPERWLDRGTLWNEVQAGEKRCDAQLARDIEISLPRELGQAEAIRLVRDFVREQFVDRGMVADLNVHWTSASDGGLQPHAHVMLTMRQIGPVRGLKAGATNDRDSDRERHPGRGTRRARRIAQDPGVDGGGKRRGPDRSDPGDAAGDPEQPADHHDQAWQHRAAARLARLIAAVRLRTGLRRFGLIRPEPVGFGLKEPSWNSRALLEQWRVRWAEMANERLAEAGYDVRIDHRSNVEQGIALVPQNKIGLAGVRRAARGEDAERAAEHLAIARRNGEAMLADPGVVLDAITRQHSTFSRRDLARFVDRHTADAEQFTAALAKVEASAELVRVGVDGRAQDRFSTREMLAIEQRMEASALALSESRTHLVKVDRRRAAVAGAALGEEQAAAFGHVTRSRDLTVVVGYAGTGKSTMLGVARRAWETEGYRVVGAALSGIAAEGLEAGSGIESRTLASLEFAWKDGRDLLTQRDVLVVDEAGMVGSRQMERVLSAARAAGAKVVLVGDPEQLQAIEAGAAFRAIVERVGSVEITQVVRQREAWQRDATKELATGRTGEALGRYERAGMVQASETRAEAMVTLVAGWDSERRQAPQATRVMLASTRVDVAALNGLARGRLRVSGELGPDQVVQTEEGERSLAVGDRVMFRRNERRLGGDARGRGGVAVKNGTLGTVAAVDAGTGQLTVRVDGPAGRAGKEVAFSLGDYRHLDHGYAATVHKAQGVTVDHAHVLASSYMDRHAAYVGLTRHRSGVSLHYGRDEFADSAALARVLGRERSKDTTLDYGGSVEDLAAAYAARRGLGPERETVLRQKEAQEAEQREIDAGKAGFRDRYEARKAEEQAAREREAQARDLVGTWEQVLAAYSAALPGLERDAALGGTRERLLEFGRAVREQAGAAQVLRERGAEFGMGERPDLARIVASTQPEQVVAAVMDASENELRTSLRQQAAIEKERVAKDALRRQEQARQQQVRPSSGPSPGGM